MADYDFTMPWPPTINHWHQPCRGRIIKGSKARKYESDAVAWIKSIGLNGEQLANDLRVKLTLHPPHKCTIRHRQPHERRFRLAILS